MSCAATGTDAHQGSLDFETLSGQLSSSGENEHCTISPTDTDIRHIVKVHPRRGYYTRIKVRGILPAGTTGTAVTYSGPTARTNVEWEDEKPILNSQIVFKDAVFKHSLNGSQQAVEVEVFAKAPYAGASFVRVDQADLNFSLTTK
jgi:hypothetical protein